MAVTERKPFYKYSDHSSMARKPEQINMLGPRATTFRYFTKVKELKETQKIIVLSSS